MSGNLPPVPSINDDESPAWAGLPTTADVRAGRTGAACCPEGESAAAAADLVFPLSSPVGSSDSNPFLNFWRNFDGTFDAREIEAQGKEIIKDLEKYGGGIVSIQKGVTGATAAQRKSLAAQLKVMSKEFAEFAAIAAKGVAAPQ